MAAKKRITTIELGDEVKDTVTGHKGIVIAKTQWLNGCVRVTVQGPMGKDGKMPDSYTFDVEQLTVTKAAKLPPPARRVAMRPTTGGGGRPDASRPTVGRR